ncbi:MAG: cbb3-type cytochrome oxidase assembly protein CcoS [Burkholderiales bacterium]|nr:cbb3-type cytochrome oxidase assembly protein CcoS [Burkholderiales bacterium]
MSILVVLIGVSIVVLVGAGIVLFWAVDHGQFDDMETPGLLPLTDVDPVAAPGTASNVSPPPTPSEPR